MTNKFESVIKSFPVKKKTQELTASLLFYQTFKKKWHPVSGNYSRELKWTLIFQVPLHKANVSLVLDPDNYSITTTKKRELQTKTDVSIDKDRCKHSQQNLENKVQQHIKKSILYSYGIYPRKPNR